jgi:hypothetical protein
MTKILNTDVMGIGKVTPNMQKLPKLMRLSNHGGLHIRDGHMAAAGIKKGEPIHVEIQEGIIILCNIMNYEMLKESGVIDDKRSDDEKLRERLGYYKDGLITNSQLGKFYQKLAQDLFWEEQGYTKNPNYKPPVWKEHSFQLK